MMGYYGLIRFKKYEKCSRTHPVVLLFSEIILGAETM
jgi:hypothetical protein